MNRKLVQPFHLALLVIFLVAVGTRLFYFQAARLGTLTNPDTPGYVGLAESLSVAFSYSTDSSAGAPGGFPADLVRPPGYPVFLSLINPSSKVDYVWTALVQSILGGLFSVILTLLIGRLIDSFTGLTAGIFYAVDWITILHTPIITADLVYSIALTLAIFAYAFYLQKQRLSFTLIAGLVLGMAAMIKPAAQLHLLTFVLAWAFQSKRRWSGLAFLLTYLLFVTPWMLRNYHHYELFTLSTIPTINTFFYNAVAANHKLSGKELDFKMNALDNEWKEKTLSVSERARQMNEESWRMIRGNWPVALKQALVGLARTSLGTGRETMFTTIGVKGRGISPLWHTFLPLAGIIFFWGVAIVGARSLLQQRSERRALLVLFVIAVVMALLPSAGPMGYSRFRVHAMPTLCFLAAFGAKYIYGLLVNHLWQTKKPDLIIVQ
jgi:4-amino-4-deoxy-L-arabinose transferase-like glycosyltransferase